MKQNDDKDNEELFNTCKVWEELTRIHANFDVLPLTLAEEKMKETINDIQAG